MGFGVVRRRRVCLVRFGWIVSLSVSLHGVLISDGNEEGKRPI